jgi:hypothetical protein
MAKRKKSLQSGRESAPPGTVQRHAREQESGYGGKGAEPKKSADQNEHNQNPTPPAPPAPTSLP